MPIEILSMLKHFKLLPGQYWNLLGGLGTRPCFCTAGSNVKQRFFSPLRGTLHMRTAPGWCFAVVFFDCIKRPSYFAVNALPRLSPLGCPPRTRALLPAFGLCCGARVLRLALIFNLCNLTGREVKHGLPLLSPHIDFGAGGNIFVNDILISTGSLSQAPSRLAICFSSICLRVLSTHCTRSL